MAERDDENDSETARPASKKAFYQRSLGLADRPDGRLRHLEASLRNPERPRGGNAVALMIVVLGIGASFALLPLLAPAAPEHSGCDAEHPCASDHVCVGQAPELGRCWPRCGQFRECPAERECRFVDGAYVCLPLAASSSH